MSDRWTHPWPARLARRFRALVRGGAIDRELDDELRFHVEMEAEELARTRGLEPGEARRQALVAFGGVERYKEAHRDARGVRWIEELVQDVRYSARSLRRSPAFTLSSVLVLALGIGASTAVFSAVDAVLLARLPYPADDRLVRVYQQNSPTNRWTLSVVDYRAVEGQARTLSTVGAAQLRRVAVSAGREPEQAWAAPATSGFFRALGVRVARGRLIERADEPPGAPPVVVVGHAFARRTFGEDASAVGRSVTIDGVPHTIVGVLPRGVRDLASIRSEVWPVLQLRTPERRGPFGLFVVGRLRDGATVDGARRELAAISERIFPEWASSFQDRVARLTPVPLRAAILGDAAETLGMFAAAVGLVLLIAVANVASLMLVRTTARWREVTLRTVLGATRVRLVRLLVTESLVLAVAGAAVGVALGALGLAALGSIGAGIPRLAEARLDLGAAAFAGGVALLAGAVVGAYPVALLARRDAAPSLQGGDRTVGAGRSTQALRGAFVVAEFALALPLLAGAALLLNSFVRLQRVEPGLDAAHLLTVNVSLPSSRYTGDSAVAAYWTQALPRVLEVPGVAGAGLGDALPPHDPAINENNFDLVDRPVPPGGAQPTSPWPTVSADYFAALGVPLVEGRLFTPADSAAAPPVVVVSRAWARHYFPDGRAVGRTLVSGGCVTCPPTTVVGVVGDVKYQGLSGTGDAVYSPLTQGWSSTLNLFVRTAGPPEEALGRVRAALRSVDAGVPLDDAAPMEERLYASVARPRHWTTLLGGFAAAALALAAVGIFGMLSYTVSARRREIGVRMALGARRGAVVGMIVRRGMTHALAGAGLGLLAALLGRRWLAGALYDVSATDPPTLAAVTLLLLGVAFVACWLPARRAAAIDPVEAMRVE